VVPDLFEKNDDEPITPNGRFQIKQGVNGKLDLFEVKTGKMLASLIALDEEDWAVVTPDGLFDASPKARQLMHYIIGLEPISLAQMKDVYYVRKSSKVNRFRKSNYFPKKICFPIVEFSEPKAGQMEFTIKLTSRGGGIGQVQVLINGKEFVADARPKGFDPNTKETTFTVSVKDADKDLPALIAARKEYAELD